MGVQAENLIVSSYGVLNVLVSIFALTLLYWLIQWKLARKHLYELAKKTEFPRDLPYLPIIGHSLNFTGGTEKILSNILKATKDSVFPRTVWLAYRLFYMVVRPEDMEVILNSSKCLQKDDLYKFSIPLAGKGVFNLDVKEWKRHRKAIAPTFNQKILDQFVKVFVEQANVMLELLDKEVGKEFDGLHYISSCSLDSVLETSMGVKFHCQTKNLDKLEEKISRALEIMMLRMFNVPFHSDFIFNLTKVSKEEQEILEAYKNLVSRIVTEKKRSFREKQMLMKECAESDFEETKTKNAFLDHLIQLSEDGLKFTDTEIVDEVRTFVIAGSDTSSTVIAFALTCIAIYPEVQQKVYEEIIDVIGESREIEYTDLPKLKYLEMVIKEAMRIFPLGPNIVRKVEEDLQLETCTIPKGAGIVLCIMTLHRSSLYYKDPMKFDPERFSPEEISKRHPYAYLPFSGGPRNCIGLKYGMLLVKCVVAASIRKFYFESTYNSIEDIKLKQSLLLATVDGHKYKITPREIYNQKFA